MEALKDRSFDNTLTGAQQISAEFIQYKTGKKAEYSAKKPEIERIYSSIGVLLKRHKRPEFHPPSGLAIADIAELWTVLEEEERKKEHDIRVELSRQEKLYLLVRRFQSEAEDLELWINEKELYLNQKEHIESLFKAQFATKQFEAYSEEFKAREPRLQGILVIKEEIISLNYNQSDSVADRTATLASRWDNLRTAAEGNVQISTRLICEGKSQRLQQDLQVQQKKENLRLDFASQAKEYISWVKEATEQIGNYNFGYSLEHVIAHKTDLEGATAVIKSQDNEKIDSINHVWQELQQNGVTSNSHTSLSIQDIETSHSQLQQALGAREEAYARELQKHTLYEEKRKEFAGLAQSFVEFLSNQRTTIEHISGEPQDRINSIRQQYQEGEPAKQQLQALSVLATEMVSLGTRYALLTIPGIYGNKHTQYTLPGLKSRNIQLNNHIVSLITALMEEKEMSERIHTQEAELAQKEKIENMILQFSRLAGDFIQYIEVGEEILQEPINVDSVEEAEKLIHEYNEWSKHNDQRSVQHEQLVELANKMTAENITDFSGVTIEEITNKWSAVNTSSADRRQALEREEKVQKSNDTLRREFSEKANSFYAWLLAQKDTLEAAKGELTEQLNAVQAQHTKFDREGTEQLHSLEDVNKKAESVGITNFKYLCRRV